MKISPFGIDLIKSFEGCRLVAYRDSAGIPTIGWGTVIYQDGRRVKMGEKINQIQADKLLLWQIGLKEVGVNTLLGPYRIAQHRFDVLVDFVYNLGIGALGGSTLLKVIKVNPNDYAIHDQFLKWCKITVDGKLVAVPGLLTRRRKEADIWFDLKKEKTT